MTLADGSEAFVGQHVTKRDETERRFYAYYLVNGEITTINEEDGACIVRFIDVIESGVRFAGASHWCRGSNLMPLNQIEFDEAEFLSMFR